MAQCFESRFLILLGLLTNANYFVFQVFPFFGLIRFKNVRCTGTNGQYGTCFSRQECANAGGVASGSCARNWGTCCISRCRDECHTEI